MDRCEASQYYSFITEVDMTIWNWLHDYSGMNKATLRVGKRAAQN